VVHRISRQINEEEKEKEKRIGKLEKIKLEVDSQGLSKYIIHYQGDSE